MLETGRPGSPGGRAPASIHPGSLSGRRSPDRLVGHGGALRRALGEVDGSSALGPGGVTADPVVAGGTLLASRRGVLEVLDLSTGKATWGVATGTILRPPAVAGLDGGAGEPLGERDGHASGREPLRRQAALEKRSRPGPVQRRRRRAGRHSLVQTCPRRRSTLEREGELWRAKGPEVSAGGPAPSADGTTLFAGLIDQAKNAVSVAALDAATGRERWRVKVPEDVFSPMEPLWAEGDTLVVPLISGGILGLDAKTGKISLAAHAEAALGPRSPSAGAASGRFTRTGICARSTSARARSPRSGPTSPSASGGSLRARRGLGSSETPSSPRSRWRPSACAPRPGIGGEAVIPDGSKRLRPKGGTRRRLRFRWGRGQGRGARPRLVRASGRHDAPAGPRPLDARARASGVHAACARGAGHAVRRRLARRVSPRTDLVQRRRGARGAASPGRSSPRPCSS